MNGFKTERIGTWAYIETTKEFMAGVTDQQLYDFLSELSAEEYNWFNVFSRMEPACGPSLRCSSNTARPTGTRAGAWSTSGNPRIVSLHSLTAIILLKINDCPSVFTKNFLETWYNSTIPSARKEVAAAHGDVCDGRLLSCGESTAAHERRGRGPLTDCSR